MKKLFIILLAGVFIAGCNNDEDNKTSASDSKTDQTEEAESEGDKNTEKKDVYQIGETAVITSDMYDFDYEVTVNDFELTEEVEGVKINEFLSGADDTDRFAAIDVTIKNISDEAYIPNEMFSANFSKIDEEAGHISEDEFFTERDEELAPGEEITGPIVFLAGIDEADTFLMKYEVTTDEETHFELPNPEM
ncbi:hypothetical protein JOC34_000240 [Virgibacillus halotolerans]|uniref:DUF4352 domain-containing protein n=1 Tax=Virgibacillus halotolerans TaxID=1071053 RepID=UPI0019617670|nr:DUF4352 domain-containing protein [Virgibacillus halotolerans]MBM7597883.1 hypothetical protein [Virgibacillus halotolerans]